MFLSHDRHPLLCLAMIIIYAVVDARVSRDVYYREVKTADPFLMGMSVFMGYYAFDLQGIFYGPLLICTVTIVHQMFNDLDDSKQDAKDANHGSDPASANTSGKKESFKQSRKKTLKSGKKK